MRQAAVAGAFYPDDPAALKSEIDRYLAMSEVAPDVYDKPKALIVPHAGYIYSGPVAAAAYRLLLPYRDQIHRVVLLGPSHHVGFSGVALSSAEQFITPLGIINIDVVNCEILQGRSKVCVLDVAHAKEHALEVQLPFLQQVLSKFELVPLVVGSVAANLVADLLRPFWEDDGSLIVLSTDLSHFLDYEAASQIDNKTNEAIIQCQWQSLNSNKACGCYPLKGLLCLVQQVVGSITPIMLCNSGDTAGDHDRVVGYGAWSVYQKE